MNESYSVLKSVIFERKFQKNGQRLERPAGNGLLD